MKRTTLVQIGRKLGVSAATVSLALRDHPRVSARRRQQVKELARRLNYTPDFVARALVTRRTRVLGLVVADVGNPYFARLARRVEDAARERGFGLIITSTDEDPATERRVLEMMLQRRVDGVVLTSAATSVRELDGFRQAAVPFVLLGRVPAGARADSVVADNRLGGYRATRHLLAVGHRRIAIISGSRALSDARGRFEGYAAALREAGCVVDPRLVREVEFSESGGEAAMRDLAHVTPRPDAVFICHNMMVVGALRALGHLGLRVPEDVAIAGFDEVEWADVLSPPMTMAEQPTDAMARHAVELIVERITGKRGRPRQIVVEPEFHVRGSCGWHLRRSPVSGEQQSQASEGRP
ncbi:MAG: LacI family DNA-binding transcriptional regulator [Candidatus Rokubacteria bacterium]|nr:LacI family DNA-binding transcriptional regulator [Candidatus Rokubacteria bacterium]